MRRLLGILVVVVGVAACQPVTQSAPPPQLDPPDSPPPPGSPTLNVDTGFVTGLSTPWDMAFLPNGTMFFTQRDVGGVSVRFGDGTIVPAVQPADSRDLMGIAVEPTTFFVCYVAASDVRVVRYPYTLGPLSTVVVGPGVPIVTGIPFATAHSGCRIRVGPDNKLWVTTGDGAIATAPQDINSLAGKVLRVNLDGTAPSDNPFAGVNGDDRVYTYGHRNPQGIAFSGAQPYSVEHGSAIDDEVNKLVPGGNGGWDPIDASGNYDGYDTDPPMTDFAKFPDAMDPVWHSGFRTVAPSGATLVQGPQWGAWDGALIVAFLKDSKARVMLLDGAGGIASSSPILPHGIRLRSVVQGPDGDLYVSTDQSGFTLDPVDAIWKVTPS